MRTARGAWLALALAVAVAVGCCQGFPMPFPELDATVSQALVAASGSFPPAALSLSSGFERGAAAVNAAPRGYRAAGYFPDAALYVDATGARERAEYGGRRSMADDMHYPSDYPHYRSTGPDYAAFGAPEATALQEQEEQGALEDDTPMPGDAAASVDSGREPEPLREGERLVEDGPMDVDDTEIIPLAGEDDPRAAQGDGEGECEDNDAQRPRGPRAHAAAAGPPTRYAAMA